MPSSYAEQNAKILEELARHEEEQERARKLANYTTKITETKIDEPHNNEHGFNPWHIGLSLTGLTALCFIIYKTLIGSTPSEEAISVDDAIDSIPPLSPSPQSDHDQPEMGVMKRGLVAARAQRFIDKEQGLPVTEPSVADKEVEGMGEKAAKGIFRIKPEPVTEAGIDSSPAPELSSLELSSSVPDEVAPFRISTFILTHKWKIFIVTAFVALAYEEYRNDYPIIKGVKNTYYDLLENGPSACLNHLVNKVYDSYNDLSNYLVAPSDYTTILFNEG